MKAATAMSTITSARLMPPIVPPLPVSRFTVDEHYRIIQEGVLTEEDDVELLEGCIVPKMSRNPPHHAVISMIMIDVPTPRLPPTWFCCGQSAITTADSEADPDTAAVRGTTRVYLTRHPGPHAMALVIEVADSSTSHDRLFKARIYAAASVPTYWIVNLLDHQVKVCAVPTGPDATPLYCAQQEYQASDLVPFIVVGRDLGAIPAQNLLP